MTGLIELANRVLEWEVTPDTPGYCTRTMTLRIISGPPLTVEEYERASAAVVAELVAAGNDVRSWGVTEEP